MTTPLALAAGTLALLAVGAQERPVLAIADDIHWFDPASAQAITFAARRLGHESVALLLAQRSTDGTPVDGRDFERIELAGLSSDAGARWPRAGLLAAARRLATVDPSRAGSAGLRLQLELALFGADDAAPGSEAGAAPSRRATASPPAATAAAVG